MQLICNYYTLRQDGSRAFIRSWNFQVKKLYLVIYSLGLDILLTVSMSNLTYGMLKPVSGICWWEELDKLESAREWPNYLQAWSVCFVASYRLQFPPSIQIFQSLFNSTHKWWNQPVVTLHLLFGTLWLLSLIGSVLIFWISCF